MRSPDVGKTRGASKKVSAGPTLRAVRRDCQEQSVSFAHLAHPTVAMGVHNCCGGRGRKTAKTSFSVVLWAVPTVVMTTIPSMFISIPFGGIPTTVDLLAPAIPPTIKPALTDIY